MFELPITPEFLSFLLAGLVAILFDWFPGLTGWYDPLSPLKKKQIMAVVLAVIIAVIYGLGCAGIIAGLACTQSQIIELVNVYLVSIGINQGVHLLTKPS